MCWGNTRKRENAPANAPALPCISVRTRASRMLTNAPATTLHIPPPLRPSARDVAQRSERKPMSSALRRRFLGRYFGGVVPLLLAYATLMTFRSLRDYFASTIYASVLYVAALDSTRFCALRGVCVCVCVCAKTAACVHITEADADSQQRMQGILDAIYHESHFS